MDIFHRSISFDIAARADGADKNVVPAVLSTDDPIDMGGVSEILEHSAGAIDMARFPLPLVEDHRNAGTAIAVAENPRIEDGKLRADIRFGVQARATEILADVLGGVIRSLSIGYRRLNSVRVNDTTMRTTSWLPMHVSPVAGPADTGAGFFRSADNPPGSDAQIKKDIMDKPEDQKVDEAALRAAATDAARAEAKEIATLARSLDLPADDFIHLSKADATAAIMRAVVEAKKKALPEPGAPAVTVTVDDADKKRNAIVEAIVGNAISGAKVDASNPFRGRSLMDQAAMFARHTGVRGAADWSRKEIAQYILGEGQRDAANITTGSFPSFVMLNAVTKAVGVGFEMGSSTIRYPRVISTQRVPDFKSYYIGGLGTGNLVETPENVAFPELAKSEGVYNNTAKVWGGTLSLTIQALVNDDTASFNRSLQQAGVIAQKTIDRRVFQKLLMGTSSSTGTSTWTNNTSSGCTIVYTTGDTLAAARANIGRGRVGMMNKVGLDSNPLGAMPAKLIVGPTNGLYARGLLGNASGQLVANSQDGLEVIETPWLEASTLTGNSTTTYYLLADPNEATGLVLSLVSGYETPQVQEYDSGAVGARKWKVWMPFEADLWNLTNPSGTVIIPAAQQCTT